MLATAYHFDRCVMALIRGLRSHCPCPVRLIPRDKLWDHAADYPIRSAQNAIEYLQEWEIDRVTGEKALKAQSLRPVEVCYVLILFVTNVTLTCSIRLSERVLAYQLFRPPSSTLFRSSTRE